MRKIAFLKNQNPILKLMIYAASDGIYLFGFDTLADGACIWDRWYSSIAEAYEDCCDEFNIVEEEWIDIANPYRNCRDDLIASTPIGNEGYKFEKLLSFGGLTGNERLFVSGFMDEFYKAKIDDKPKANKILTALGFDMNSIKNILSL